MTVPKILIADSISPRGVEELGRDAALEVSTQTGLNEEQLLEIIPEFSGVVVRSQTKVPPRRERGALCGHRTRGRRDR